MDVSTINELIKGTSAILSTTIPSLAGLLVFYLIYRSKVSLQHYETAMVDVLIFRKMVAIYSEKYAEINPESKSDLGMVREEAQHAIGELISNDFQPSKIRRYFLKKAKRKELIESIEKSFPK